MKLKLALSITLALASFASAASPDRCNFNEVKGDVFEFAHPQPILVHHDAVKITDKSIYPFWYEDANTDTPLDLKSYFGRMVKIQTEQAVKRVVENTFKDVREKDYVNYYSAIADNCEQIYVRVNESDFPHYYSEKIDFASKKFDFLEQERWLGITNIENVKSLENGEITSITINPDGHQKVYFVDITGSKALPLDRYTTLKVLDAKRLPFYVQGNMLSNHTIEVMYQGEKGYINADYRYMFNGNPLLNVNDKFINAISSGKLVFGMSKKDVLLSLGMPVEAVSYPVYETPHGFVTDYVGKLKDRGFKQFAEISHWSYPNMERPLIFNKDGIFEESKQQFNRFDPMGLPDFMWGKN